MMSLAMAPTMVSSVNDNSRNIPLGVVQDSGDRSFKVLSILKKAIQAE